MLEETQDWSKIVRKSLHTCRHFTHWCWLSERFGVIAWVCLHRPSPFVFSDCVKGTKTCTKSHKRGFPSQAVYSVLESGAEPSRMRTLSISTALCEIFNPLPILHQVVPKLALHDIPIPTVIYSIAIPKAKTYIFNFFLEKKYAF